MATYAPYSSKECGTGKRQAPEIFGWSRRCNWRKVVREGHGMVLMPRMGSRVPVGRWKEKSFSSISNRLLRRSCLNFINLDLRHYWLCSFRALKVQFARRTWTLCRTYLIMAYVFFYPLNSDPYVNAICRLRCFILLRWMIKSYLYTPGSLPPYPIHWFFALFISMEMPTSTFIHISYLNNVDRMF
jgi:hypothetical protein